MILFRFTFLFFICFFTKVFSETSIKLVSPPWGYVFNDWDGPPIDIINYIPPNATQHTPLLVVIPGASRDTQRFHASWLDLAKKHHFSVLTIGAGKEYFPDEYSYNAGNVLDEKGNSIDKSKWLFSAIEMIFNDFKKRHGFEIESFNLFGHSAGGGFVHRYLLFNPNAPVKKAVSANPAFVTLPNYEIKYPFGLNNIPLKKINIKSWFSQSMAIILGSNDIGPRTKPLSNGPMAKAQGPNCLTRGKLLFEEATIVAKRKKYQLNWKLIIANGVGHDNYNIAPVACNYLFDLKK
tara:strand:- start:31 stop:909 length:879 start_codon:yes stop_codon:yes gene_type:complete